MDQQSKQERFAVLIDGDNAQASLLPQILAEISKFGLITVKRIYGDWTTTSMNSWKKVLHKYAIQPIQQFRYTVGKNATDSAMIIDAMDLLYTKQLDGFCIVSSDSDFTRLAARLREEGLMVYGFGEEKTPEPFVSACDKFIRTEVLRSDHSPEQDESKEAPTEATPKPIQKEPPPLQLIANVIDSIGDEDDWANLSTVGQLMSKRKPDFDTRLYGHKKLSDLLRAYPKWFELKEGAGSGVLVKALRK